MGERLLCKQEVDGSIPFTSTSAASPAWSAEDREKQSLPADGSPRALGL